QAEESWKNQPEDEDSQDQGLNDEHDVPGIPPGIERSERTHAIIIGKVQQNMAERAQYRVAIEQLPVGRQLSLPPTLQQKTINPIDHAHGDGSNKGRAQQ